jgi:hypothetical protein
MAESVTAAQKAVVVAIAQYKGGLVDFNRVSLVEQNLVTQQNSYAQAFGAIATGLIQTYRALGGGWEIRLNPETKSMPGLPCPPPGGELIGLPPVEQLPPPNQAPLLPPMPGQPMSIPHAAQPAPQAGPRPQQLPPRPVTPNQQPPASQSTPAPAQSAPSGPPAALPGAPGELGTPALSTPPDAQSVPNAPPAQPPASEPPASPVDPVKPEGPTLEANPVNYIVPPTDAANRASTKSLRSQPTPKTPGVPRDRNGQQAAAKPQRLTQTASARIEVTEPHTDKEPVLSLKIVSPVETAPEKTPESKRSSIEPPVNLSQPVVRASATQDADGEWKSAIVPAR